MPAFLREGRHAGEFIRSEATGWRSRENVVVTGSAALGACTVLGRVLATGVAQEFSGTGNGVLTPDVTTPFLAGVQEGAYRIVCIEPGSNAGTFVVFDPQGVQLGTVVAGGSAFANQVRFAIADGAADFIAGDTFTLWVKAGTASAVTGTGNGAVTLYGTKEPAQPGAYSLVCTAAASNGGTFSVTAPDGTTLAPATVGTRYSDGGLDFKINDGSTDFIVGDAFTLTVTRGKVKPWDPQNTDGSGTAWGILVYPVDATAVDVRAAALVRDAGIAFDRLVWAPGLSVAQKETARAQLAGRGIICR